MSNRLDRYKTLLHSVIVINDLINTDSPLLSWCLPFSLPLCKSTTINMWVYFCEIHNSFLPINVILKLSEIRMTNSSLLLPNLKARCCNSTVKVHCWLKRCNGWMSRRFWLRRIQNFPNSKNWPLWFACSLSLGFWKSWHYSLIWFLGCY